MSSIHGENNPLHTHGVGSVNGGGMPSEVSTSLDSPPLSAGKSAAATKFSASEASELSKLIDTKPDHAILNLLNSESELPNVREKSSLINLGMAITKFFVSK